MHGARCPGGGRGWYGAFVVTLAANMTELEWPRDSRWQRYLSDGFYPFIGVALAVALAASLVTAIL